MPSLDANLIELGRRLRRRRRESRLTPDELAELARVRLAAIEAFERGAGGLGITELARLAWALGVPPASFAHTAAPETPAMIEPSVMLKASGTANLAEADRDLLAGALRRARSFATLGDILNVSRLDADFKASVAPRNRAYLGGYAAAHRVRELLPERPDALRGLRRLIEDRFNALVVSVKFRGSAILGASCRIGNARVIALDPRTKSEAQRRFVLAHELGHQLFDLDESGVTADADDDAIGFWLENSPSEKRANAFAAMLLAPKEAVDAAVGQRRAAGYGLDEARQLVSQCRGRFGLSFAAMAWHLHNLGYIQTDDTVRALLIVPERDDLSGFEEDTRFDGLERRVLEALSRDEVSRGRASEFLGRPVESLVE